MKLQPLSLLVLLLFCACKDDSHSNFPSFSSNLQSSEVWKPVRDITAEKSFAVVYTIGIEYGGSMEFSTKIFCLQDSIWEKIEFRKGIRELDTIIFNMRFKVPTDKPKHDTTVVHEYIDVVEKELLLRKACRRSEGEKFLGQLISYGLFELKDEKELLEECKQSRTDKIAPEWMDSPYTTFYIIQGNKVRQISYQLSHRAEDCPGIEDWAKASKIVDLFEREWYIKKHY